MKMQKNKNLIEFIIGTKAQLIKTAPVLLELDRKSINYDLFITGQHKDTMIELIESFKIKKQSYYLIPMREADSVSIITSWFWEALKAILKHKQNSKPGALVIVHGDTLSTLIGCLYAKRIGGKILHIEAGLRSYNWLHPFPEEIIRVIVSKLTDRHYTPGSWAASNIKKGEIVNTIENTMLDSLKLVNSHTTEYQPPYGVVSIHRFENVKRKKKLKLIVNYILMASKYIKVKFVLHSITAKQLRKYKLFESLNENENIELLNRMDYFNFNNILYNSNFLITDGGSNQEEAYYMDLPCLLMRKKTERKEGLNKNVILSMYNKTTIESFIKKNLATREKNEIKINNNPSKIIADDIQAQLNQHLQQK